MIFTVIYSRKYISKIFCSVGGKLVRLPQLIKPHHYNLRRSRRKVKTYSDIDIVLLHPHYVYVPTPSLPTPPPIDISIHRKGRSSIPFRERPGSAAGRSTSLLVQDVVTVLEERGLIAATMLSTPRKWQGIVRVPEGMAGHTWYRREQIRLTQGQYRRMNMTFVASSSLSSDFNIHVVFVV
jgi:hypothetical protein